MRFKKRKQSDVWNDVDVLTQLLRTGKHPRGEELLGPGSGTFYQCLMRTVLRLRTLKRKTKNNAQEWNYHDERIQRLMQIARAGDK